ncbi:MAG TPA: hypothetical protein VFE47_23335 [Tepidisphaeraceae bacterium]|jgi:hypothetical protein|nr:hypothetical protein [Tepidisphaeraceae bacterium]
MKCCKLLSVAILSLALLRAHARAADPTASPADMDESGRPVPPPVMSAETLKACRFLIDASAKQAAAISDPKDAASAVRCVSASRAEIGDFDGAIAAWEKIPGGEKENLSRTARHLAVHRSLYGMAGLAARVKGNAVLDSTLASALAEHGRLADAVVFLDRVKKPFDHSQLLLEIVQEACRRRNDKVAAQMLEVHRDELLKDWTESNKVTDRSIARFASLQAGCGKLDGARATIKTIKDPQTRAESLATVGGALAYRGDLAGAKSIAAELPDWSRDNLYDAIISALAAEGKIADAQTMIPLLQNEDDKADTLCDLAEDEARLGQIEAAEAILARIDSHNNVATGELRFFLVKALLKKGDIAKAHALATKISLGARIDYKLPKVEAFCCIARAQARKNDPAVWKTIDEAIAEEKKAREDGKADRYNCSYILWAIASTGKLAKMTEICESLTADPVLRCEIYGEAVDYLIAVPGGE